LYSSLTDIDIVSKAFTAALKLGRTLAEIRKKKRNFKYDGISVPELEGSAAL
jgi:hypothetical protein